MNNGTLLLLRLALSGALSAFVTWAGWKLGQKPWALTAFVFSVPVVAVAVARPLVELVHEGAGWLWAQPLKEWEGRYYEFASVQVRIYEHEGELWFAAPDVLKATSLQRSVAALLATLGDDCRRVPGTRVVAMNLAGVERLLEKDRSRDAGAFMLWARRDVTEPWRRKREGRLVPG